MSQNKTLLLFLFISCFIFSQERKVDTIYVYEEIIIHDTVYIEKPLNEIKLENVTFTKGKNNQKDKLELTQNGKKIEIQVDSTNIILSKTKKPKSLFLGVNFHFGYANNGLFKKLNAPNTLGFGVGVWTSKKLFNSNFSLGIGIDGLYWVSPFSFNASQNNSVLNGYYFTESNNPKLFESIESKHFQFQIPLQLYYKVKRFTPSIGVFASISDYKANFKSSSGNLPLTLDETQVYNAQALQFGYLVELQYEISKHISVGINFSSGKANNLILVNKNDGSQTFKTQNSFTENRWLAKLIYLF